MIRWFLELVRPSRKCRRVGHDTHVFHYLGLGRPDDHEGGLAAEVITVKRKMCRRCCRPQSDYYDRDVIRKKYTMQLTNSEFQELLSTGYLLGPGNRVRECAELPEGARRDELRKG